MIDLKKESERIMYRELISSVREAVGTNFTLLMRNSETEELTLHKRYNQPCQGGELRKYKKTHPNDCTRPDDPRPQDLRHPFPDGIPEAVGVMFVNFNSLNGGISPLFVCDLLDFGPYRHIAKGYELVTNKWTDDIVGVIFNNLDVDSTAFVNMLQFVKSAQFFVWSDMLELGFDRFEIADLMYLTSPATSIRRGPTQTYSYYFSTNVSLKRLLAGEFNDLTEGTFKDRFDYNRPEVQDLFKAQEGEHATNFNRILAEHHKWSPIKINPDGSPEWGHQPDLCQIVRDIIKEELEKCQ